MYRKMTEMSSTLQDKLRLETDRDPKKRHDKRFIFHSIPKSSRKAT